MKGLIFDIKRFAIHDGPGIRTTVFFKGCPLECWWCHNPESRLMETEMIMRAQKVNGRVFEIQEEVGSWKTVGEIMEELEKERVFMDESGGGVTLSGGEPLMQHKFVLALLKEIKSIGMHSALDTTGYVSAKVLGQVMDYVDLFLFDLKHLDDMQHQKYTGVSNTRILENLEFLYRSGKEITIRLPVIPGINDHTDHIRDVVTYLHSRCPGLKKLDLLPYHRIAAHKYKKFGIPDRMKDVKEPDGSDMGRLKEYLVNQGFEVHIGG